MSSEDFKVHRILSCHVSKIGNDLMVKSTYFQNEMKPFETFRFETIIIVDIIPIKFDNIGSFYLNKQVIVIFLSETPQKPHDCCS